MNSTTDKYHRHPKLRIQEQHGTHAYRAYRAIPDDFPVHFLLGYAGCVDNDGKRRWHIQHRANVICMVAWKSMYARPRGHIANNDQFDSNQAMRSEPRIRQHGRGSECSSKDNWVEGDDHRIRGNRIPILQTHERLQVRAR